MSLFDQVKLLYDCQLYDDVKTLSSMLLTLSEHNPDVISAHTKYQLLSMQGDGCFELHEYKKAESIYLRALQVRKLLVKTKGKTPTTDGPSEMDVKYRLHLCYRHQKAYREALTVLESLNAKQRNAKINLALAKLYQRTGLDRSAVTSYKEVLRECSLSVEAAQGLLSLGVKGAEVASLTMPGHSHLNSEWLSSWIKAQAFAATRDYSSAITTLKALDNKPMLRDNVPLLCQLGDNQFLNGDYSQALVTFQRAHSLDPLLTQHMDTFAYLLYVERKGRELGALANKLMSVTSTAPEPWVAMGYYSLITRKVFRAVYFAQKAYMLDSRCIEALLMKGAALLELKKNQEAIPHYRETLRLMPHRFEPHKGLVDCYLASRRTREAISCAAQAYKQLSTNARTLTLYASVLAKEPLSLEKAKTYAEKAIKIDPNYLEPVYVMADIFRQQRQYVKGVEFLKKQLVQHSTCRLHQMMAEFLEHTNDHIEALDHFNIALRMNPLSVGAYQGRDRVEKQSEAGVDNAYDMEMDELDDSENEAELEESDIESAWSDIDLN